MLCATGHRFSAATWLAIPALFVAAVLAVVGLPMLFLRSPVELYSGMFGAAAALAAVTSSGVAWRHTWQRLWLRWPVVAAVAALGLVLDGVTVSAAVTVLVSLPSAIALGVALRRRQVFLDCGHGEPEAG